jgi:hypothetical protein
MTMFFSLATLAESSAYIVSDISVDSWALCTCLYSRWWTYAAPTAPLVLCAYITFGGGRGTLMLWCLMLPNCGSLCDFSWFQHSEFQASCDNIFSPVSPHPPQENHLLQNSFRPIYRSLWRYLGCIINHQFISAQRYNALLLVPGFTNELRPQ